MAYISDGKAVKSGETQPFFYFNLKLDFGNFENKDRSTASDIALYPAAFG